MLLTPRYITLKKRFNSVAICATRQLKNRDSWKSGKGGEIAGNGLFMSPISVKACSPRAMMSPPPTMPSPRVTVGDLLGPQRDLFSIGVGSADSAEWWGELELSPPRADTPGLQKWRYKPNSIRKALLWT